MGVPSVEVNLLAVFVAAIASMVIGALWYSPLLFGRLWMQISGISPKMIDRMKKKGKVGKSYFWALVGSLIASYVLAHFVRYVTATTFADGAQLAFWAWLGFEAPILLGGVLWEGKPFKLFLLNAAYHLIALIIAAGILAVWQ